MILAIEFHKLDFGKPRGEGVAEFACSLHHPRLSNARLHGLKIRARRRDGRLLLLELVITSAISIGSDYKSMADSHWI